MNPLLIAALATGNPVLILAAVGTSCLMVGVGAGLSQKDDVELARRPPPSPVAQYVAQEKASAIVIIENTAQRVNQIATTTQRQQASISATAMSAQQSAVRLSQTSNALHNTVHALGNQTDAARNHLHDITRLRTELSATNAALRASQLALATRENEINVLTTQLRATHESLQASTTAHQATATSLIDRALRTQAVLQNNVAPLIASKEAEISVLRQERAGLRATIRTMDQELSALRNPGPDRRTALSSTPIRQTQALQKSGFFPAPTRPQEEIAAKTTTPQNLH